MTAKMNSCGIIIGGAAGTPVVIHANTDAVTQPVFNLADDPIVVGKQTRSTQSNEYKLSYGTLAAQAIAAGYFGQGTQNVGVIDPEFYLTDKLTSMSVFGIKSGNGWTFYANLHTTTKKGITLEIWPNQPKNLPNV